MTRLAARSVLARCRENGTPLSKPLARGSGEGSSSSRQPCHQDRRCPWQRLGSRSSGDVWWNVVRTVSLPAVHVLRHTEEGDEALPSSRCRDDAGHPRRLSRRIRAPRDGAGGGWPAAGAAMSRRGPTTRPLRRHLRLQLRSPSQRRTGVMRRRGAGTARSPGGPRAWSSSGCSAPRCAGRSPP